MVRQRQERGETLESTRGLESTRSLEGEKEHMMRGEEEEGGSDKWSCSPPTNLGFLTS